MKKQTRERTKTLDARKIVCSRCGVMNEAVPDMMGMDFFSSVGKIRYADMYECKCGHKYEREQRTETVTEERTVSKWKEVKTPNTPIKTTPIK